MQSVGMTQLEKTIRGYTYLCVFLMVMIFVLSVNTRFSAAATSDAPTDKRRVIVLDPGHGGNDIGVRGTDGSFEKAITLNLARIIAKALKPEYQVVFTRNGDYQVDLTRRTSIANHKKADLFISIHTGGSRQYQADQWTVYYFINPNQQETEFGKGPGDPKDAEGSIIFWDTVQARHQKESRIFAETMKNKLANTTGTAGIDVSHAALRVLEGADMPAIMIETGYLTNPQTEKRLNDPRFLLKVAENIRNGIKTYFHFKK